ncbi:MAG: methyltransferase, partial [Actinomycetes bacterium]
MSNGSTINPNERGDMSAFAEGFPHEDFFMQQARKNGSEVGASDPTVGSGGVIAFIAGLISAKSIVEIGTGSGVSGLWAFRSAPSDSTLTSIDSEREHSASARNIFEEAGISAQRFRL